MTVVIICVNSCEKFRAETNTNKRPIGLIAPPFKINFLATEN